VDGEDIDPLSLGPNAPGRPGASDDEKTKEAKEAKEQFFKLMSDFKNAFPDNTSMTITLADALAWEKSSTERVECDVNPEHEWNIDTELMHASRSVRAVMQGLKQLPPNAPVDAALVRLVKLYMQEVMTAAACRAVAEAQNQKDREPEGAAARTNVITTRIIACAMQELELQNVVSPLVRQTCKALEVTVPDLYREIRCSMAEKPPPPPNKNGKKIIPPLPKYLTSVLAEEAEKKFKIADGCDALMLRFIYSIMMAVFTTALCAGSDGRPDGRPDNDASVKERFAWLQKSATQDAAGGGDMLEKLTTLKHLRLFVANDVLYQRLITCVFLSTSRAMASIE
jgi:hypothetical protein